ncbi:YopX family protein [Staphylococcus haemolyticus]|uniref:YopX family protein n=1 Tax=Staphylococcus haemolyticus TaxID=1283 RepID=UPI0039BCAEA4
MIKFRAWKKINTQEMFNDVRAIDFDKRIIKIGYQLSRDTTRIDTESLDNVVLMQSTGLKDKNGVEIFEGDIVKNSHKEVGFIKNCSDAFCFNRQEWNFYLSGIGAGSPFEILGNVHQNPELLEVE